MAKAPASLATSARFDVLDAWRGICALWVAIYHFRVVSHLADVPLFRSGRLAVDFFFVLSGFVIMSAYGDRLGPGARLRFFIRRFGRLYPLHIATLAAVLAMECARWGLARGLGHPVGGPTFSGDTTPWALLPNALMIHAWGMLPRFTWNVPSWSISVEFALCILFLLVSFLPRRRLALGAMTLLGLGAYAYTRYALPVQTEMTTALSGGVYAFFLGCLLFCVYRWRRATDGKRLWAAAEWLALPMLALVPLVGGSPFPVLMFAAMILIFAFQAGWLSQLLNRPFPRRLGEISYSIYLTHYIIVLAVFGAAKALGLGPTDRPGWIELSSPWLGDVALLAYLALVVGVSSLTYRCIEAPGRAWFNRLADRSRRRSVDAAGGLAPGAAVSDGR